MTGFPSMFSPQAWTDGVIMINDNVDRCFDDQNFLSKRPKMTNHAEKTAVVEGDSSNGGRVGRGERLVATEESF